MANFDTTPHFNLKAVVKETGVQAETLRAWERRYGLPDPGRTSGGHRLYSEEDIEIVRWLTARQDEGLRISQAVELWRALIKEGIEPLTHPDYSVGRSPTDVSVPAEGAALEELRRAWVSACLTYDERRSDNVLSQAFAIYPPEAVLADLMLAGLKEIGDQWYAGTASVQQEHFASELATRQLEALISAAPPPTRNLRLLLACPPEEDHALPPLYLAYGLRRRGWDVLFLGANVPVTQFEATLSATRPSLAVVVAQTLHSAATTLDFIPVLERVRTPMAFGGLIFQRVPELARSFPGRYLGDALEQAVPEIESLLRMPVKAPAPPQIPEDYRAAAAVFRDHRARIDWLVSRTNSTVNLQPPHLDQAAFSLGQGVLDALRLGDLAYLEQDLIWISGLMRNLGLSEELLAGFLISYRDAVKEALPEEGGLIIDWLSQVAQAAGAGSFSGGR